MAPIQPLFFLVLLLMIRDISSLTDSRDVAVLRTLKDGWKNTPPSWENSDDPCGGNGWEGVTCYNSRVTRLTLSTMGLVGELSGAIGDLEELTSLDLSFNEGLTGSLPPQLGLLKNLSTLILAGSGFSGTIPTELGNLTQLYFLDLSSNSFTGVIPPSLGSLSKLYWLGLANNKFTGSIPVSTLAKPGMDSLKKAKHFNLNNNQLSGPIPDTLFSSEMALIHVLFDGNQFTGSIPETIGLVQTLEVLRLDRNALSGKVPSNIMNLVNVVELNLANNKLSGPLPNLTGMNSLSYLDLSNNSFDQSEAPAWLSTLSSLTTLIVEYGPFQGIVPSELFSLPQIQQIKLRNNAFNGTLDLGSSVSQQLELIDLQNNLISSFILSSEYHKLMLRGNPICANSTLGNTDFCKLQEESSKPYSTSLEQCGNISCVSGQKLDPASCECAYPYQGTLYFRGPSFRDLSNATIFHTLEMSLWVEFGLTPNSVYLDNPFFNSNDYLQVNMGLFPSNGVSFNTSDIQRFGSAFSNQTYKSPNVFGPYYFIASAYTIGL
ncbi:leucine-rich repeat receptor protein kinase HPCA1 [Daucus carota subsp. sativus]|uniref:leucine-rich repeat receptor protein kinase HPCA1 n=1 Tax=Daucus carota subsp. sativus TaxID=79200 RepID=UPI0007EF1403|nr:PREDICTED: probable leucine-rich repeat receptor-like protein kinase At5g49770 isoform X1 [Daucus carota subsp. sativus]XP_017225912.1 PREDICTED: probable leucine-rich repeat receptor-like protein kinase At5g49770 isoform X1 [Daucus carota subsp. sativus]XP_017225913.1 PREDICTED: probable leucine-rich repeat receptor-like protein kinase At5g49770 isoform X1 [Daucus carota subsp. sativus]